ALGRRRDAQVHETGSGDVGRGDAVDVRQRFGKPAGKFARGDTDLLAELHREVGGVVAVLGIARTLDRDRRGKRGGIEAVLGEHRGGGGAKQLDKVGGGHEGPSYVLGRIQPNSFRSARGGADALIWAGPTAQLHRDAPP